MIREKTNECRQGSMSESGKELQGAFGEETRQGEKE